MGYVVLKLAGYQINKPMESFVSKLDGYQNNKTNVIKCKIKQHQQQNKNNSL